MKLIRSFALTLSVAIGLILTVPGIAFGQINYDYQHAVAFDSITGLYWRLSSNPDSGSWQDTVGISEVNQLFSDAGVYGLAPYSREAASLMSFFVSDAVSPSTPPSVGYSMTGLVSEGYNGFYLAPQYFYQPTGDGSNWNGSWQLALEDFNREGSCLAGATCSQVPGFWAGTNQVFQVSATNPVPEPESYTLVLTGIALLGVLLRGSKSPKSIR